MLIAVLHLVALAAVLFLLASLPVVVAPTVVIGTLNVSAHYGMPIDSSCGFYFTWPLQQIGVLLFASSRL
jgi:hypothetical protein